MLNYYFMHQNWTMHRKTLSTIQWESLASFITFKIENYQKLVGNKNDIPNASMRNKLYHNSCISKGISYIITFNFLGEILKDFEQKYQWLWMINIIN